ncbi:MAG TPA: ABC transporter permease subunit [Roseiarcus sp.]
MRGVGSCLSYLTADCDPTAGPFAWLDRGGPISRVTRTSVIDVLRRDYIRATRARGVGEVALILRHGLPNALLVVLTVVGLQIGNLLGGAFIVETIFS